MSTESLFDDDDDDDDKISELSDYFSLLSKFDTGVLSTLCLLDSCLFFCLFRLLWHSLSFLERTCSTLFVTAATKSVSVGKTSSDLTSFSELWLVSSFIISAICVADPYAGLILVPFRPFELEFI